MRRQLTRRSCCSNRVTTLPISWSAIRMRLPLWLRLEMPLAPWGRPSSATISVRRARSTRLSLTSPVRPLPIPRSLPFSGSTIATASSHRPPATCWSSARYTNRCLRTALPPTMQLQLLSRWPANLRVLPSWPWGGWHERVRPAVGCRSAVRFEPQPQPRGPDQSSRAGDELPCRVHPRRHAFSCGHTPASPRNPRRTGCDSKATWYVLRPGGTALGGFDVQQGPLRGGGSGFSARDCFGY